MDGKQFLEVFPTLQLKNDLKDAFQDVCVEHIFTTKRRDFLRIYISADRIIDKKDVFTMEDQIKKQLFDRANITVKIYEHFNLSKQYTPKNLYHAYRESILCELKEYSPVMYSMLKKAEVSFEEDKMMLLVEELVPFKEKAGELISLLEKIFCERCGVFVNIAVNYTAVQENPLKKEEEGKLKRQVAEITARVFGGQEGLTGEDGAAVPGAMMRGENVSSETLSDNGTEKIQTAAGKEQGTADKKEGNAAAGKKEKPGTDRPFGGFGGKKGGFGKKDYRSKKSDDPAIIWGSYDIEEEPLSLDQLVGEMGEVVVRGKLLTLETKPIPKIEKTIVMFSITDFKDTIMVKVFVKDEQIEEFLSHLNVKKGTFLKIKGMAAMDKFDRELTIGSVTTIKVISDFTVSRMDYAATKRVELHCHTKMSDMDGVSEVTDIVKRAYKWGHPAIAITDHGVVQALADVFHTWCDLWGAEKKRCKEEGIEADRQNFFKIILGVEGYLVDDLKEIVVNPGNLSLNQDYVVFDLETTGFSPVKNRIIEIGAVKIRDGKITDRFSTFVNPKEPIPYKIQQLTGIRDEDVMNAPEIEEILPQFLEFSKDCVMVAHNASFDMSFIKENSKLMGLEREDTVVDTVGIARILLPNQAKHTLDACAKTLGVSLENHHRAVDDAEATAEIFMKFLPMLTEAGVEKLSQINAMGEDNVNTVKKLPYYHVIILAKNEIGRINLYKLVSASHLTYYNKRPKIPKSLLQKYREGLIVGSACEAGELYRAMLDGKSDADLYKIAGFYDYLEIQPLGNNEFMIESERVESVHSMEDIMDFNRKIVAIGEALHKPVCATCDVHFLDPEDEVYRRIIMAGKGFKEDKQAPLYLRTTEEMLAEFEYLGSEKAREVVITNTNLIADCVESIDPVRPDKSPPIIPNSDEILTKICYNKAHEIYGEKLPDVVEKRLEKELNAIIKNGFAVMYIIAQKLVWKSVEDGYLVGSRGSVGSSFVANMAGITEVNSLSPHYYCAKCHYYDFDSPEVKAYSGKAGCDMPDKVCPQCGEMLMKDGFDIPFETFLGFKGDKEPDIRR